MGTRVRFEPVGDGTPWRVEHEGGDVEGHMPWRRFAVEDEDAEGHAFRGHFSLEPEGEDEGGEPLYRIAREGDVEGHMPRIRNGFSLEPTGEEEGGEPVYRMQNEGDDAEGHGRRFP